MSCSNSQMTSHINTPLLIHANQKVYPELNDALCWVKKNCPALLPMAETKDKKLYVAVVIGRDAVKNGEVSAEELKQYGLNFQEAQKVEDLRLQWIFPGSLDQEEKWQGANMLVIRLNEEDGGWRLRARMFKSRNVCTSDFRVIKARPSRDASQAVRKCDLRF